MKKPNAMLARIEAKHRADIKIRTQFVLQQTIDAALIAAADIFGLGEKRAKKFTDKMAEVYNEIAQMTLDDAESDSQIAYTKTKVDERLKEICGEHFVPWDERYTF